MVSGTALTRNTGMAIIVLKNDIIPEEGQDA
jgi:hypothetical protein